MRAIIEMQRLILLLLLCNCSSSRSLARASSYYYPSDVEDYAVDKPVKIAKCCEEHELLLDGHCVTGKEANNTEPWTPTFEADDAYEGAKPVKAPKYVLMHGQPKCRSSEKLWDVYHHSTGTDKLVMLIDGKLRHSVSDQPDEAQKAKEIYGSDFLEPDDDVQAKAIHFDYPYGHYCADKIILTKDNIVATYAKICVPNPDKWGTTDNIIKKAIDPAFRALAMMSYLVVAIVYFVLPQLRDLTGNIVTSMMLCLIVNQCASFIKIFTDFANHINFLVAESVMYISLLAAFFWLNALGYYMWNTFRSRSVFLRSTDKKKYCYYSSYVWGSTLCIAGTALFAHFMLETNVPTIGGVAFAAQETLGWLGLSVLFTAMISTIIVDLCFVLTTIDKINRMRTYGRIHHKMKHSFRMLILIFGIMSTGWLTLLFSLSKFDGLIYCHIIVNVVQALSILYVCVFGQKRVLFLLGKTCNCCTSDNGTDELDWGEEMTAINAGY